MITGHCIAGGFIFSMAHDYRISSENSTFCMNEIHLGMSLPKGMMSLFYEKLSPNIFRDIIMTGKKYSSKEALDFKIID